MNTKEKDFPWEYQGDSHTGKHFSWLPQSPGVYVWVSFLSAGAFCRAT